MVWRRSLICVVLCAALCFSIAAPAHAAGYSVYPGSISTTYITYFRDMLSKIDIDQDYVFFRSAQSEYTLVSGDLSISGSTISSKGDVSVYTISSSSSTYSFSVSSDSSFSLSAGRSLVYSSLGYYPSLHDRGDTYGFLAAVLLALLSLLLLFFRVWDWRTSISRR